MRLVVTGGGTGGHIYPALAVAEWFRDQPGTEAVTYVGRLDGLESRLAPEAGFAFTGVRVYGMPRPNSVGWPVQMVRWLWTMREAYHDAKAILSELKPDVVFGTGGYVSAPVLLAAKSLGMPYAVHEPDAQPGLSNRFLSRDAQLITTSFEKGKHRLETGAHKPTQRIVVTGNPIRGSIGGLTREEAKAQLDFAPPPKYRLTLLVTGGSQGARKVNQAVAGCLPSLILKHHIAVMHVTGAKLYDETCTQIQAASPDLLSHPAYWLRPYTHQMAALLACADFAVCRAGSLSLSEMYVSGLPTILIPYPYAAANHQFKNAEASVAAGASLLLPDAACTPETLLAHIEALVQDAARFTAMRAAAQSLAHPHATEEIGRLLLKLAESHTK